MPSEVRSLRTSLRVGALVEEGVAQPVEIGAGLLLDKRAPELDQPRGARAAARVRSGARAPASRPPPRAAPPRACGPRRTGCCDSGRRAWRRGSQATPSMRREPMASTRACSTASNRARDGGLCGARRRWTASLWQASRRANELARPADDRGFARIGLARRLGQPRLGPFRPGHQRRLVGRVGDLELGMARQRPRAGRERPLERLVGRIGLAGAGLRLLVGLTSTLDIRGLQNAGAAGTRRRRKASL